MVDIASVDIGARALDEKITARWRAIYPLKGSLTHPNQVAKTMPRCVVLMGFARISVVLVLSDVSTKRILYQFLLEVK